MVSEKAPISPSASLVAMRTYSVLPLTSLISYSVVLCIGNFNAALHAAASVAVLENIAINFVEFKITAIFSRGRDAPRQEDGRRSSQ